MQDNFLILRDKSRAAIGEPFAGGRTFEFDRTFGPATRESMRAAPPAPKFEVETLDTKGVRDIARDPEVVSVARLMPTKLIEPVAIEAQPAAQDAWGIAAVGADVSSFTGDGVVVAVLDSGIDAGHQSFQGVQIIERDFRARVMEIGTPLVMEHIVPGRFLAGM